MPLLPRIAPRRPTNKAGVIILDGKELTVLLRDASHNGARLRVMGRAEVPDRFQLVSPMEKINAQCVVIWRRGSDLGVAFDAANSPPSG